MADMNKANITNSYQNLEEGVSHLISMVDEALTCYKKDKYDTSDSVKFVFLMKLLTTDGLVNNIFQGDNLLKYYGAVVSQTKSSLKLRNINARKNSPANSPSTLTQDMKISCLKTLIASGDMVELDKFVNQHFASATDQEKQDFMKIYAQVVKDMAQTQSANGSIPLPQLASSAMASNPAFAQALQGNIPIQLGKDNYLMSKDIYEQNKYFIDPLAYGDYWKKMLTNKQAIAQIQNTIKQPNKGSKWSKVGKVLKGIWGWLVKSYHKSKKRLTKVESLEVKYPRNLKLCEETIKKYPELFNEYVKLVNECFSPRNSNILYS
jgi:hypothetical protein